MGQATAWWIFAAVSLGPAIIGLAAAVVFIGVSLTMVTWYLLSWWWWD